VLGWGRKERRTPIERVSVRLAPKNGERRVEMSGQARKIVHEAIPQRAEGLYYSKGLSSEALAYYDDEAI
jgi:hypothetical protein